MRRSASEIIRNLEMRVARLERAKLSSAKITPRMEKELLAHAKKAHGRHASMEIVNADRVGGSTFIHLRVLYYGFYNEDAGESAEDFVMQFLPSGELVQLDRGPSGGVMERIFKESLREAQEW
jgi:hypothetical protein